MKEFIKAYWKTLLFFAVVGLIGNAVLNVVLEVFAFERAELLKPEFYVCLVLFGAMTVLAFKKVHPILLIVISAAIGIGVGYFGLW